MSTCKCLQECSSAVCAFSKLKSKEGTILQLQYFNQQLDEQASGYSSEDKSQEAIASALFSTADKTPALPVFVATLVWQW